MLTYVPELTLDAPKFKLFFCDLARLASGGAKALACINNIIYLTLEIVNYIITSSFHRSAN
jgi:hypothetical protein